MSVKDLTTSNIERQNILNNPYTVSNIQQRLNIEAMLFEGEYWLTKKMVAEFYEVEERTLLLCKTTSITPTSLTNSPISFLTYVWSLF